VVVQELELLAHGPPVVGGGAVASPTTVTVELEGVPRALPVAPESATLKVLVPV
jgi:hypothetical protein